MTPAAFAKQMELVAASSVTPVRLDDALDLLLRAEEGRYVCVTFDDGYRDNLEAAVPVLGALGIPATIFVATAIIDGTVPFAWFDEPPPALTWEEVRAMDVEGLIDFQAHTRTHPWLPLLDDARAREEIVGSKRDLEERLGREVTSFCYPAGRYGSRDVRLVREAGYRAAVTTHPGVNDTAVDPARLRRTLVFGDDPPYAFEAKLDGRLDRSPILRAWVYSSRHAK